MAQFNRVAPSSGSYFPKTFMYSRGHCWVSIEGLVATVGLTDFVFDLVYREYYHILLPEVGQLLQRGTICGALDALKIALPITAPLTGRVTETNRDLERSPSAAAASPYSRGWLFRMQLDNPVAEMRSLLRLDDYLKFLESPEIYDFVDKPAKT